jgi:hypothetical protein
MISIDACLNINLNDKITLEHAVANITATSLNNDFE